METNTDKQNGIEVELLGKDGNAFMIMGLVVRAMKKAHVDPEVIEAYQDEAMSGDYDNLLRVTGEYVEIV